MKRLLSIALTLVMTIACWAASPSIACVKIFDRKDLRTEGHELVKVSQPGNYFCCVTANNDKVLLEDIRKAFNEDRKHAFNEVEGFNGTDYSILNVMSNGYVVSIGFYWDDKGYVKLFVQSNPEAFK